jgi:hypothetical protein
MFPVVVTGIITLLWYLQPVVTEGGMAVFLAGTREQVTRVDSLIGTGSLLPGDSRNIMYTFDSAVGDSSGVTVTGWAVDMRTPDDPVSVIVIVDQMAVPMITDVVRVDVNQYLGITGVHGFHGHIETSSVANTVCVDLAATVWNPSRSLGCLPVTPG